MHPVGSSYTIVLSVIGLKFKEIIYKISCPIIEKSHSVPVTKTDGLMLLMQIVAVYSMNCGKHKNTKREHYTKLLHFKRGCVFIYLSSSSL